MKSSRKIFVGVVTLVAIATSASLQAVVRVETRGSIIATGVETLGKADGSAPTTWDTTKESDGWKTLTSGGVSAKVLVLNSPSVVGGRVASNTTWNNSRVIVVRDDVVVPSGKTLTLGTGCIVKFTEGARFVVESGGALVANGAYLAALDDDSVGGDTDRNGSESGGSPAVQWWMDDETTAALAKVRFVDGASNLPTRVYSTSKTFGTLPSLSQSGATFVGWFTAPDGAGTKIAATDVVTSEDTILYSHWKRSSLAVESNAATLEPMDASGSVAVSSGEAWRATCDADWLAINVQNGAVSYSLIGGASAEARAATIRVVSASGETRDITVTQRGMETLPPPVINPGDETKFEGMSRRVTISSAESGAEIRYTLDGSEPTATSKLYTKSFNVFDTTTIKARAFKSGKLASSTATARIVRIQTLAEGLDVPLWTVTTDGDADWTVAENVGRDGASCARSGAIGNEQKSRIATTVDGSGMLTFWWKTDCEDDEDNDNWDYMKFEVDGVEVARIDGESAWMQITTKVHGSGAHRLIWTYVKDYTDDSAVAHEDCGWVDQVVWTAFAGESEVPVAWLDNLGVTSASVSAAIAADFDSDGDGLTTAEEYVAGTDPNDPESVFKVSVDLKNGKPVVTCVPNQLEDRKYTVYGCKSLSDKNWEEVKIGKENDYLLFRVGVVMADVANEKSTNGNVVYTVNQAGKPFTVQFDAAGGTGGWTKSLAYGSAIIAPTVTKDGWTFAGWSPVPPATVPASNATYVAQWERSVANTWTTKTVTGGVTITGCSAPFGALTIPATVNGKKVVAIADYAFFKQDGITSVKIPAGVATIGTKAFKGCVNMTSVTLPASGLKTLGQAAFQDCVSLREVDVPKGVDYLWSSTFEGCTALQRASLPEGVTAIGTSSFANCKALTQVNIPSTVKTIKSFAFFSCESLAAVALPQNLATIEQKAFKNCTAMKSVKIPSSVTTLGKAAFFNTGLVEAAVPGSVKKVDDYCFQKCAALKKMTLESGVEATGQSVWANDEALETATLPSTLKTLGAYAFFRCPSLKTLNGEQYATAIGEKAFKHCASLTELTLSAKVTAIPKEMCNYCSTLKKVDVDGTSAIKSVGQSAFSNCPALVEVEGLDADALATVKRGREWKK